VTPGTTSSSCTNGVLGYKLTRSLCNAKAVEVTDDRKQEVDNAAHEGEHWAKDARESSINEDIQARHKAGDGVP
jgi:hypothetical protein